MRQKCVKNASKMRGTPLGENTFWTIPMQSKAFSTKGRPFPLQGGPFRLGSHQNPLQGELFPLQVSFNCLIVGRGLEALIGGVPACLQECRTPANAFSFPRHRGISKRYPEIGDRAEKVLSNLQEGSIEPPFGPRKGSIEPL